MGGERMVRFIPAAELKARFGVFGHFYSVQVTAERVIECRSVLEIVDSADIPSQTVQISGRRPDAVFIMMNPGSSRPLTRVEQHLPAKAISRLSIALVPTMPDTTQYQVMRLMHYCQWRHVRVLNLSDLRCPKSNVFFRQFQALESEHSFDAHSIFSARRKQELAAKLTRFRRLPVVCAWGVSPQLDPLIDRCQRTIGLARLVKGLKKAGTTDKFLHPLPSLQSQKLQWVNQMVAQCLE